MPPKGSKASTSRGRGAAKGKGRDRSESVVDSSTSDGGSTSVGGVQQRARGRGRASTSTSRGSSKSRDVESEFDTTYEDANAYKKAVEAQDDNPLRYIAPTTQKRHQQKLEHFIKFLAATLDRALPLEERIKKATASVQPGCDLPSVKVLMEFLTFWARGSQGKIKGKNKHTMTAVTFTSQTKVLLSVLQRSCRKSYSKEEHKAMGVFAYNASRGEDAIVLNVKKSKLVVSMADLELILNDIFDRRSSSFSGRAREALQVALICLFLWAFGVRPGCMLLKTDYKNIPGEVQTLLNKDVELQYEGRDSNGEMAFTAKITFRWMKGMRDNLDENLVVRLRSLPREKGHLDPIIYLLAQGVYRNVFLTDVMDLLKRPPPLASSVEPFKIQYRGDCGNWPVFASLSGARYARNRRAEDDAAGMEDVESAFEGVDEEAEEAEVAKDTSGKKRKRGEDAKAEKVLKIDSKASVETNMAAITAATRMDYSKPASEFWLSDPFKRLSKSLGLPGLRTYDFRRAFAMLMKNVISVADLEYFMGHRPGSKIINKAYTSDDRAQDTTAARFNLAAESSEITRNAVGWGVHQDRAGTTDRLSNLARHLHTALGAVEKRFGSLETALQKQSIEDADICAVMDLQALFLAELEKHDTAKAHLRVMSDITKKPAESSSDKGGKGKQKEAATDSVAGGSAGLLDFLPVDEDVFAGDDVDWEAFSPLGAIIGIDGTVLPPMPQPEHPSSDTPVHQASTIPIPSMQEEPASDSQAFDADQLEMPSLTDQLKMSLNRAKDELKHPLLAQIMASTKGEAASSGISYLLGLYQKQDLHERGMCLLCVQKNNFKQYQSQLDMHTYSCENKAFAKTLQRCPFCAAMLDMVGKMDKVTQHLLDCADSWIRRSTQGAEIDIELLEGDDLEPSTTSALTIPAQSTSSLPTESTSTAAMNVDEEDSPEQHSALLTPALPLSQLSKISEEDEDAEKAIDKVEIDVADSPVHIEKLLNPINPPYATFYHPLQPRGKVMFRPICSICVDAARADWQQGTITTVPFPLGIAGFQDHWIVHFRVKQGRPALGDDNYFDWEESFGCGLPGCAVEANLLTLFPHWQKIHGLSFISEDTSTSYASASSIPEKLEKPLRWQTNFDPEKDAEGELLIYVSRLKGNIKKKKQREKNKKKPKSKEFVESEDENE